MKIKTMSKTPSSTNKPHMSEIDSNPAQNSAAHGGCPAVPCSAYRGTRCPICFWALYDGDWCQGPKWCANRGKSVEIPIRLTNAEAAAMIRQPNQTHKQNER